VQQSVALEQTLKKKMDDEEKQKRRRWKKVTSKFLRNSSNRKSMVVDKDFLTIFKPEGLNALNRMINDHQLHESSQD
jgi:hypothetical protein